MLVEVLLLPGHLDPLGNDLHAEALAQSDDGANDVGIDGVVRFRSGDVLQEAAVDLEVVGRDALEVTQRRVAGTEIIDADIDATVAESIDQVASVSVA